VKRRVTTILASDVVSFSRLVAEDEEETLRRLTAYHDACEAFVTRHGGRIFNTAGDSIMCEFESPLEAVRAAIDIQEATRRRNLAYPPNRWLQFRIGISTGEVADRSGDLLGMAVNIAARLETLAKPGGVCVVEDVHEAVSGKISVPFVDLGERTVKNIPVPVHAFAIAWPGTEVEQGPSGTPSLPKRAPIVWVASAGIAALILSGLIAGWLIASWSVAAPEIRADNGSVISSPAQQVAQALLLSTNPAETFSRLSQKGGLVEDFQSAPALYYKAILFEAKGETAGAHRAYYALARMGLEFIDPHLRYAALVQMHEGKAMARQVYAELHEDVPTRATALLYALQLEAAERKAKINALIGKHPDFAPAYFFLAEEHSQERLGRAQTARDRQIEFAALSEFLRADQEGRLRSFFLDHSVAADWLARARNRRERLEDILKSASAASKTAFER
jgi:class 3 adenylate cyclase